MEENVQWEKLFCVPYVICFLCISEMFNNCCVFITLGTESVDGIPKATSLQGLFMLGLQKSPN